MCMTGVSCNRHQGEPHSRRMACDSAQNSACREIGGIGAGGSGGSIFVCVGGGAMLIVKKTQLLLASPSPECGRGSNTFAEATCIFIVSSQDTHPTSLSVSVSGLWKSTLLRCVLSNMQCRGSRYRRFGLHSSFSSQYSRNRSTAINKAVVCRLEDRAVGRIPSSGI
jgi:hypothetical protein